MAERIAGVAERRAPASIDSNDGATSFSSSLMSKNCAGANSSRTLRRALPWADGRASVIGEAPRARRRGGAEPVDVARRGSAARRSGARRARRADAAARRRPRVPRAARADSRAARCACGGCACQLRTSPSACVQLAERVDALDVRPAPRRRPASCRSGPRSRTRGSRSVALPRDAQRQRAFEAAFDLHLEEIAASRASAERWRGSRRGSGTGTIWMSTSKPTSPSTLKPSAAAYRLAPAPNWIVLAVSAM